MARRKKRYTSVYTPGTNTVFAFASVDPPTTEDRLGERITQLYDRLEGVPSGFIDACTNNEAYIGGLDHFQIGQWENQLIVKELERFTPAKFQSRRSEGTVTASAQPEGFGDFAIDGFDPDMKDEITDLHKNF